MVEMRGMKEEQYERRSTHLEESLSSYSISSVTFVGCTFRNGPPWASTGQYS